MVLYYNTCIYTVYVVPHPPGAGFPIVWSPGQASSARSARRRRATRSVGGTLGDSGEKTAVLVLSFVEHVAG